MVSLIAGVGFVGSALFERLAAQGEEVVGIVRDVQTPLKARGTVAVGDICDTDFVYRVLTDYGITRIFHLAAHSSVGKCQQDPYNAWRVNVMGTVSLLEAARRCPTPPLIIASESDKVYGNAPCPYTEESPLLGSQVYPATKVAMDAALRSYYSTYGMPIRSVRSANIFGPGDLEFSRLVPGSIRRMLVQKRPALLYSHAKHMVRDFVYLADVVNAFLTIAEKGENGEAYNVSGSGPVVVGELIQKLATLCGGSVKAQDSDIVEIEQQWLDASKLKALGWEAKIGLDEGLTKTVEWYRNYFNANP